MSTANVQVPIAPLVDDKKGVTVPWHYFFTQVGQYVNAGLTAGTGITLASNIISLSNTGVTATTYGSPSTVSSITVNLQGQITSASSVPIVISYANVTGLGTIATQSASAVNITGGTISVPSYTATGATPVVSTGQLGIGTTTATTATAGGTGALPATVLGYLEVNLGGTMVKVPYYSV